MVGDKIRVIQLIFFRISPFFGSIIYLFDNTYIVLQSYRKTCYSGYFFLLHSIPLSLSISHVKIPPIISGIYFFTLNSLLIFLLSFVWYFYRPLLVRSVFLIVHVFETPPSYSPYKLLFVSFSVPTSFHSLPLSSLL